MMKRILMPWFILLFAFLTIANGDTDALSKQQGGVAERYQRLEELLLRLADVEAAENPERSALLRRAARQSRDKFVLERLRTASQSLKNQEFQKAVENQAGAQTELASLLKLLMSEDRSKRIRDEKERFAKLIKDLKRNLNNQRSARARTENGADLERVQKEQKDVTERSKELSERLDEDDDFEEQKDEKKKDESKESKESKDGSETEPSSKKSEPKDGESKSGEKSEPSESKPSESKPSESKPSDSKPSDSKPQDGKPQQGESQQGESQPQQPQSPEQEVQQQLEKAIENMKQAEKELDQSKREEATEQQRQAEEKLRAAIDRLERILRQLREEEMQRELAKLESRLRKMAAMQTEVLEKTKTLSATPKIQRDRTTDLKAGDLAFDEKKITLEADRAMLLLREEGSSVAFPEVVAGIRSDTAAVADRLARTQIDVVTQGIQADILVALEEMIAALQKAQRDLEKQRQQQQQGKPGQSGQGEQPLVEALAELKLLRTMQSRIKSTTDRYSGLLESGESAGDEVLPLLQNLAQRQNRLYQITRDLVTKRNK
ncbi:hypothetical protein LF1_45270 [Rubripirellula obstinata]|uniref:Chromosome partition protein Smc n=1 Tax=Rubripirellula obstinata TaxID=406547 RepID=A0A5B1CN38_9BACT|nr:hypothetical protein [Rubripirellula obstinata]KAA1261966.1 hypothetical protein LF1_45270 [Rubripirellula obstinata]